MEFNKLVFAGLSVGCLAAAAGGSYLAVRQNQSAVRVASSPTSAASCAPAATGAPADASKPVTESEGVIAPERAKPEPSRAEPAAPARPRAAPSSARRTTRRSRAASSRPLERRASVDRADRNARRNRRSRRARPRRPRPARPARCGKRVRACSRRRLNTRKPEPPAPPPPPAPEFVDLTVPSDAVLGLQIERTVSSELARVEDKVDARVTRDVRVSDRIAIPAGSTVRGSVTEVDRGGRMKGKARLAIRFHTIVLADGTQVALKTDPVVREGQSPGGESAAKVGGAAIGGAILGAILGGGKGAAIGGAVGAAGGTAAAMTNDRNPATLPAGTTVTVRMQAPVTVTVQKE